MTDEETQRLHTALEPMRKASYEQGFEAGINQGVLNVYIGLLNWVENGQTQEEAKAAADTTRPVREWLKEAYPHINEYFTRLERRLG